MLCALFLTAGLDATVELTYMPDKPVLQDSALHVEIRQSTPNTNLVTEMDQKLQASILLQGDSGLPLYRGPFAMQFTLRELAVDLTANGSTVSFNAKQPNTSLFLAEVNDMIDRPITLNFNEKHKLQPSTSDVRQLTKELPVLGDIHPHGLIDELFVHLFALAGTPLEAEKEIIIDTDDMIGLWPKSITYTITSIDSDWINATINAQIPEATLSIDLQNDSDNTNDEALKIQIYGTLSGTVQWSRQNALVCNTSTVTTYQGSFAIAGQQWSLAFTLKHTITSKPENL